MDGPVWKRINVVGPPAVNGLNVVGYGLSGPEKPGPCHLYWSLFFPFSFDLPILLWNILLQISHLLKKSG